MESQTGNTRESVCLVEYGFYPFATTVKREAEALLDAGLEVHVVCLRGEDEAKHEILDGVEVHRIAVGRGAGHLRRYFLHHNLFAVSAALKLLALDLAHRFRIIQAGSIPACLAFSTLGPRLAGAKVVLRMREPTPELFETETDAWYGRMLGRAFRLAETTSLKYADRVVTATREMREVRGTRGADVNKITVVVHVPDDKRFRLDRHPQLSEKTAAVKREERRKGTFRILYHGGMGKRSGTDLVVRAIARLQNDMPGVELRFMAEGGDPSPLLSLAADLNVADRVTRVDPLSPEKMIEEILTADVAVIPARRTSHSALVHPSGLYEFIALEKPVVISRLDSVAAYFPEESLVFFGPDDADDLAEKLRYVFAHPEEMTPRVERAKEILETHRWDREKKKFLGVHRSLLAL